MKLPDKALILGAMQLLMWSAPALAADSQITTLRIEFIGSDGNP